VQALKKQGSEFATLAMLLVLSLCAAGLYTALVATGYWETVYQVLLVAGAIYAFVIQRFEGKPLFTPEAIERQTAKRLCKARTDPKAPGSAVGLFA
jgi:hypothetical protein